MAADDPAFELSDDDLLQEEKPDGLLIRMHHRLTLVEACRRPMHLSVVRILVRDGANVNQIDKTLTPLLAAIEQEDLVLMAYLIKKGADVNLSTTYVPSPIWFSVLYNKKRAYEFLLKYPCETQRGSSVIYLRQYSSLDALRRTVGFEHYDLVTECVFVFPGHLGLHPHKVARFSVGDLIFTINYANLSLCKRCYDKKETKSNIQTTGVFVGLLQDPENIKRATFPLSFSYTIDVMSVSNQLVWYHGKEFTRGIIAESHHDWGAWDFERYNDWPKTVNIFDALKARIRFTLHQ